MSLSLPLRSVLFCSLVLLLPAAAFAQANDSDFDNMAPGPWPGVIIVGSGNCAEIVPVSGGTTGGAPLPHDASGNMLCIDTREKTEPFGVRIHYDCAPGDPEGICQVRYGFSGAAWVFGAGFHVYTDDDGSYDNPDDQWEPPVGIPPSTTRGNNSENEPDCTIEHTLDIIVQPNTVAYFDGFTFDCIDPTPVEQRSWSTFKETFRGPTGE